MARARGLLLAAGLLATVTPHAAQRLDLSPKSLARLATRYAGGYERQFQYLVADESIVQRVEDGGRVQQRRLEGELFLTWLPAAREWVAVHDVARVDGEPVPGREDLRALLAQDDGTVLRRLLERNTRYDLGDLVRNFSSPLFALIVLDEQHAARFAFDRRGPAVSAAGATLATLTFRERDRPTLVKNVDGGDEVLRGTIVMDAATGAIRSTEVTLDGRVNGVLTTTFAWSEPLSLWVPDRLSERYERGGRRRAVTADATYTNYRRFDVRVRIR